MNGHDRHPVDRLLAYEDLTDDARRRIDEHLKDCADCRALLARFQDLETRAGGVEGLPPLGDDPLGDLSPDDRAAAACSREALRRRVAGRRGRNARILVFGFGGTLALAATLAVLLLGPWRTDERDSARVFADLRLGPAVELRDADAPVGDAIPAPGAPAALRFTPARTGWPVVVRVEGDRAVVLCPTADAPGWRLPAGLPAVVPPPGSGVTWPMAMEDESACWLVALADGPTEDPAALARDIATAASAPEGESVVDRVLAELETRYGATGVVPAP